MTHVNDWFLIQERIPGRIDKRRVYIASDDPTVLPDAREKYVIFHYVYRKYLNYVYYIYILLTLAVSALFLDIVTSQHIDVFFLLQISGV